MHSSRMHTGRSLTVFQSLLPGGGGCTESRGVYLVPGGVLSPGGFAPRGVCLLLGGVCLGGICSRGCLIWGVSAPGGMSDPGGVSALGGGSASDMPPSPVNRMTDRCKNITLATTSLRPVTKEAVKVLHR